MRIINLAKQLNLSQSIDAKGYHKNAETDSVPHYVLAEQTIDVFINGQLSMKLVCTACDLPELVLGRMYTEGMIESADEVKQIYICRYGKRANVELAESSFAKIRIGGEVEKTASCCTGNHMLAFEKDKFQNKILSSIQWNPEWIYDIAAKFEEKTPLYAKTKSLHSCFLNCKGKILYCCEDIGRHNALDKVIGKALIDGVNLKECIAFSSGRIPVDMVEKAISAGIPVLCTKTLATDAAIYLAAKNHLTLIVNASSKGFQLIEPERLPQKEEYLNVCEDDIPRISETEIHTGNYSRMKEIFVQEDWKNQLKTMELNVSDTFCLKAEKEDTALAAAVFLAREGYSVFLLNNS